MLPELQKQFMDGLLRKDDRVYKQLDGRIRSAQQQLDIYRNSYQGGLLKAMKDIYPVTQRLLGGEFFEAMCLRYITQTPCQSLDINKYSETFAEFAEQFKPVDELIYLSDVIRLEWGWHRAYQTADITLEDFTPLLSFDSAKLQSLYLSLVPSMTLLASSYPVDLIWSANQNGQADTPENINLDIKPRYFTIWRNGFDSHIDLIEPDLFEFLLSIENKLNLGAIQNNNSNFEKHLVTCLQRSYFSAYHF